MAKRTTKRASPPPSGPGRRGLADADRLLATPPIGSAVSDEPPKARTREENDPAFAGRHLVRQVGPLFDLIRHRDTQMPLTAAIYGPWGSGKTTAMRWIESMLLRWSADGKRVIKDSGKAPEEFVDVRAVWFYPWKYQDKGDVLRGIIAEIIRETITVKGADAATIQNAVRRFGGFLGRSFLSVLDSVELSGKVEGGVASGGAKMDLGFARDIAEDFQRTNQPDKAFLNHFEETLGDWTRDTIGKSGKRLVVFIDDLDRCLPRVALQVLEALKLYLRVPEIIFVVGVDRTVITNLVENIYEEDKVEGIDAARYLAKMFQVEVTLDAEEDLAGGFFEDFTDGHDVWAMLEPLPEARKTLRSYILHHADRNPREIKRLFNGIMMAAVGELHYSGRERTTQQLHPTQDGREREASMLLLGARRFLIRHRLQFLHAEAKDTDKARQYAGCTHAIGTLFFHDFCRRWAEGEHHDTIRQQTNLEPFWFLLGDEWLGRVMPLGVVAKRDEETDVSSSQPRDKEETGAREKDTRASAEPKVRDPAEWRRAILAAETDELRTLRDAIALVANTKPEELNETDLAELTYLDLDGTGVSDLAPLSGLTALDYLNLEGTGVADLAPLTGLTALEYLDLEGTGVADLAPLAGLTTLNKLYLEHTGVADLAPLAGLTALEYLDLQGTGVVDVEPLAGLTALKYLGLQGTGVVDVEPLAGLTALKYLGLEGTSVSRSDVRWLHENLPRCQIFTDT